MRSCSVITRFCCADHFDPFYSSAKIDRLDQIRVVVRGHAFHMAPRLADVSKIRISSSKVLFCLPNLPPREIALRRFRRFA
jgi:hypothetical protein